jgi:hypothetical protein
VFLFLLNIRSPLHRILFGNNQCFSFAGILLGVFLVACLRSLSKFVSVNFTSVIAFSGSTKEDRVIFYPFLTNFFQCFEFWFPVPAPYLLKKKQKQNKQTNNRTIHIYNAETETVKHGYPLRSSRWWRRESAMPTASIQGLPSIGPQYIQGISIDSQAIRGFH